MGMCLSGDFQKLRFVHVRTYGNFSRMLSVAWPDSSVHAGNSPSRAMRNKPRLQCRSLWEGLSEHPIPDTRPEETRVVISLAPAALEGQRLPVYRTLHLVSGRFHQACNSPPLGTML